MNEPLFFSVIIPTYNRAQLIQKTISSILKQTYSHYEIIVIDDGSSDNTGEVIASFENEKIIYHHKTNEERGKARNTGIGLAKGDYVTFLDSDDIIYPNHLEHAAKKLHKFGLPEFYRQAHEIRNENGSLLTQKNKVIGDANEFILKGNYFSCIGIFLQKEVAMSIQFNNDRFLSPSEDWEYWLRLSARYKIHYDNTITSCMLEHKGRSVNHFNTKLNLIVISRFIKSLQNDRVFMEKRGDLIPKIKAQMYTLYCLNKVVSGNNKHVVTQLVYSFKLSSRELFRRRTLAIVKYYILNILHKGKCAA